MELVARRAQLIKSAYAHSPSAPPDFSGADHFIGWGPASWSSAIDPSSVSRVAIEFEVEAAILKGARKVREEGRGRGRGREGRGGGRDGRGGR